MLPSGLRCPETRRPSELDPETPTDQEHVAEPVSPLTKHGLSLYNVGKWVHITGWVAMCTGTAILYSRDAIADSILQDMFFGTLLIEGFGATLLVTSLSMINIGSLLMATHAVGIGLVEHRAMGLTFCFPARPGILADAERQRPGAGVRKPSASSMAYARAARAWRAPGRLTPGAVVRLLVWTVWKQTSTTTPVRREPRSPPVPYSLISGSLGSGRNWTSVFAASHRKTVYTATFCRSFSWSILSRVSSGVWW